MEMQSPDIGKLAEALSKAQSQMKGALKDSTNPFFKSKYADLSSVWNACREPLTNNGLAVIQTTDGNEGLTELVTTLVHSSGQWIRGRLPLKPVKNDPQGIGSAISYARRYGLSCIVGVIQEDDDGENAMMRNQNKNQSNRNYATINQSQVQQISNFVDQLSGNPNDFIMWLNKSNPQLPKITSYSEIPSNLFQFAMQALQRKEAKLNGGSDANPTTH